jgi:RsiW-degrading membrane proteinase PrsW (M82 family)
VHSATVWLVSITAAVIPTVVYVWILWWFDRYEKEPRRLLLVAFVWGAVPAIIVSILAERMLGQPLAALSKGTFEVVSRSVLAPVVEEVAKGLAVLMLFLFFRREFDDVLDGIIYGATIGFGFAMTENVFYFARSLTTIGAQGLTVTVLLRAFVFGLNHALFTSVLGAALGYARMAKVGCQRWVVALLGLLGAIGLHGIHNLFATLVQVACFGVLLGVISNWGGVLVVFVVMVLAWQQEKRWISAQLKAEVESGLITLAEYEVIGSYRRRLAAQWQAWSRHGRSEARRLSKVHQLATELAFKLEQGDERTAQKLRDQIVALRGPQSIAREG